MFIGPDCWLKYNQLIQPNQQMVIVVDLPVIKEPQPMPILYVQVEPEAIVAQTQYLKDNWRFFYKILTFNDTVLKSCPNAIPYIYGTSWIKKEDYQKIDCLNKKFQLTTLVGAKDWTVGHRFRLAVFGERQKLFALNYVNGLATNFYISENIPNHAFHINSVNTHLIPKELSAKIQLFQTSQFHLCIENSRQENYFTEKLLDTLITKTIPIYYGCPNIGELFDTRGWILLETDSVDELYSKLQALTPNWYDSYKETIEANYLKAIEYSDIYTNINRALQGLPEFQ